MPSRALHALITFNARQMACILYKQARILDKIDPCQKWEYATIPLLIHNLEAILDTWGDDGWELVTVIPGPDGQNLVAYLKRPRD